MRSVKKLTKNQRLALLAVLVILDAVALYDSRSRMYKRLYKQAVR